MLCKGLLWDFISTISAWNHTYGLNTKLANFMDLTVIRCASDGTFLHWPDPLRFLDGIRKWKPGGSAYGPTARQTWYPHRSTRIFCGLCGNLFMSICQNATSIGSRVFMRSDDYSSICLTVLGKTVSLSSVEPYGTRSSHTVLSFMGSAKPPLGITGVYRLESNCHAISFAGTFRMYGELPSSYG